MEEGRLTLREKSLTESYIVREQLGSGGSAVVYRVEDRSSGEQLSAKVVLLDDENCREKDTTQATIWNRFSHPNIIECHDAFFDCGKLCIILELASGGDLFDRIVSKKCFSEQEAAHVTLQVARALHHLHCRGIAHLDLKPENLLYTDLSETAEVKICDFGFASVLEEGKLLRKICGTPAYVAPEVVLSSGLVRVPGKTPEGYSTEVDLWSLGVILYVMLCGLFPFYPDDMRLSKEDQDRQVMRKIVAGRFSFPSQYWKNISCEAKDLVSKLLMRNPRQRITAAEVIQHPWIQGCSLLSQACLPSLERLLTYNQRRSRDGLAAHALAGVLMTVEQRRQRKESFGSQSDTSDNQDEIASPPRTLQLSLRKSLSPSANVSASLIIRSPSHVDVLKEKSVQSLISLALSTADGEIQRDACYALSDIAQSHIRHLSLVEQMLDEGSVSVCLRVLRQSPSMDAKRFASLALMNMLIATKRAATLMLAEGALETLNHAATHPNHASLLRRQASRTICYLALHPEAVQRFSCPRSLQPIIALSMQPMRELQEEAIRALVCICRSRQSAECVVTLLLGISSSKGRGRAIQGELAYCIERICRYDNETSIVISEIDKTPELLLSIISSSVPKAMVFGALCISRLARMMHSTHLRLVLDAMEAVQGDTSLSDPEVSLCMLHAKNRLRTAEPWAFSARSVAGKGLLSASLNRTNVSTKQPLTWQIRSSDSEIIQDESGHCLRNVGRNWATLALDIPLRQGCWYWEIDVISDGPERVGVLDDSAGFCSPRTAKLLCMPSTWGHHQLVENRVLQFKSASLSASLSPCRNIRWLGHADKLDTGTDTFVLGDVPQSWGQDVYHCYTYSGGLIAPTGWRVGRGNTVGLAFDSEACSLEIFASGKPMTIIPLRSDFHNSGDSHAEAFVVRTEGMEYLTLKPAVSLGVDQQCTIRAGKPFKFSLPAGFEPLSNAQANDVQ